MEKFLIVVDMQNDFVNGALGSPQACAIVDNVAQHIRAVNAAGGHVIFTLDTHAPDYMATHEGRLLPVPHCIRGTQGWQLAPDIERAYAECDGAQLIEKPVFGSTRLVRTLEEYAAQHDMPEGRGMDIELCGLCTDICVVSNALMLRSALTEAEISVNPALCAGVTPEKHAAALETMRSCQIDVKQ